jgi:hypothetical protein
MVISFCFCIKDVEAFVDSVSCHYPRILTLMDGC